MKTIHGIAIALAAWLAAGAASAGGPAAKGKVEEVVIVCKTHFDIGYTDLARNVVERYRTSMIDRALGTVDESRSLPPESRFVWTLSGWPMQQVLWSGQSPERRQRVVQAVGEGRLVWHALPGSLHTESLDLEDLVRGMVFSSNLAREFHMPLPRDAKMTDVPSHTWVLPTVLKQAGVDFMHIGCNAASGSPDVPVLFWWEGPDGSRLLTMYSANYGTGLVPPTDWPHKTWLALIHTGDNHGPPTAAEIKRLLGQAARELPGVKVRMGRLSDFADAILRENPPLPVVRADLSDGWIHGIMSMPIETKLARNVRPAIVAHEALSTLLSAWGVGAPSSRETVRTAYEGSLLYGEHTWGFDAKQCPRLYGKPWEEARAAGRYAKLEESWGEHAAYAKTAAAATLPALTADLDALARAVGSPGRRIVVFNPLPWPRDGVVSLEMPAAAERAGLKDLATGEPVACESEGKMLSFVARGVPAMGYRTYVPVEGRGPQAASGGAAERTLDNEAFRLRLDPGRGTIASLVDKRSGREWVDPAADRGLGQYVYVRFDADDAKSYVKAYCKFMADWVINDFAKPGLPPATVAPHREASPKNFQCEIRRGPVLTVASMTAAAGADVPHDVTLRVTLPAGQPYIDIEWKVANKKPDPWPEAGWLCFPLAIDQPTFRLGRLGSLVDPAKDICRAANFEIFCLNTGVNVMGRDGMGVGLCPIDSPLVSLGQPGLYRYSKTFGTRKSAVLVNLYNNLFGTNFQQWIGGSWTSRVRLWAMGGQTAEADLVSPAWEARSPLRAAMFDGPAGTLPPSRTGVELSRRGVLVTALGPNPDGEGTLLRLWEQAGQDGPCRVRLPDSLRTAKVQPCDLRGQPHGEPIVPRDGWIEVPLGHFAPASMIVGSGR